MSMTISPTKSDSQMAEDIDPVTLEPEPVMVGTYKVDAPLSTGFKESPAECQQGNTATHFFGVGLCEPTDNCYLHCSKWASRGPRDGMVSASCEDDPRDGTDKPKCKCDYIQTCENCGADQDIHVFGVGLCQANPAFPNGDQRCADHCSIWASQGRRNGMVSSECRPDGTADMKNKCHCHYNYLSCKSEKENRKMAGLGCGGGPGGSGNCDCLLDILGGCCDNH